MWLPCLCLGSPSSSLVPAMCSCLAWWDQRPSLGLTACGYVPSPCLLVSPSQSPSSQGLAPSYTPGPLFQWGALVPP